jgi:peptide/nickel transport system substrate-binding protein
LFLQKNKFKVKKINLKPIIKSFSLTELSIYVILLGIFCISALIFLYNLNQRFLVEIPQEGGSITEGVIGTPRLINPLLAVSETDKALVNLTYSGLMRSTKEGLVPDLAERYEVSEDLLQYRFYIREDVTFHDGKPVTADDVIFTILSAQNPELKSPKRSNWEGIGIEKINDKEIVFTLSQPYSPFLQNMTLGILPKHLWGEIDINEFSLNTFNVNPIGTGPYKISKIKKDSIGIPSIYTLEAFENFALKEPLIENIHLKFAKNQDDLLEMYESGDVESVYGINPEVARGFQLESKRVETFPLPRVFGLFLNQSQNPVLSDKNVRKALQLSTPKTEVVDEVLYGFGTIIESPVPYHLLEESGKTLTQDIEAARGILTEAGWVMNENGVLVLEDEEENKILNIVIQTSNIPELSQSAEITAAAWRELGAQVEVQTFTPSDLNSNVIRPRKFEVLLFGLVIGRDLDFYAFWHSSQRDDPGLNITSYANIEVDGILETIRETKDEDELKEQLQLFEAEIMNDVPAIFLYSPDFIYLVPEKLNGLNIENIINAEERFSNVYDWYVETDKVWEIFVD